MPLSASVQDQLATRSRRPPDDLAVFRGSLCGIDVIPLLLLMEGIRWTGRLLLFRDGATLHIDWIQGRIVVLGARWAVEVASQWDDGAFELLPISFDGNPPTMSVTELTLDVAREVDERGARI